MVEPTTNPMSPPRVMLHSAFSVVDLYFKPGEDGIVTVGHHNPQTKRGDFDGYRLADFEVWCVEACRLCESQRKAEMG